MKHSSSSWRNKRRLLVVSVVILVLFSMLIVQFYNIQIVEGPKWTKIANRQHYFFVNEPFLRGRFFSNTAIKRKHPEAPQPFVVDLQKFHLHIDPDSIPAANRDQITDRLMALLNFSPNEKTHLRSQFERKSRDRTIAIWLDRQDRDRVMEWWMPYAKQQKIVHNALFFESDYQRSYPFGKLLGQVLHTIQHRKEEGTKQALPTGGLELYFNDYLKGKAGKRRLMRSPRHALETGDLITPPQNGADIYLTINHCLQAIAEEEVAKGVQNVKAKAGWAVMMDPRTGEILALAQYPFFHPKDYQDYFNDPILIEHTRIKAVTDANEPGSIMKAITIAIALQTNELFKERGQPPLFDPEEKMVTSNGKFPGRKPLKDTHFHSYLNMQMAMWKSSNIYMARLVERIIQRLGNDYYRSILHDTFGFGKKTNIELISETRGLLPTPGKKHPNGALEWSIPTPFSMAIGHNIQANSIQMLRAFAVIANGGYFVQPTLIKKIVRSKPDGSQEILIDHTSPERLNSFPHVLDKKITQEVIKAMKFVTKPGGTARRADVSGYTEVGKTGTAEKVINGVYSKKIHCSSFIGFTPAENPAFVLIVTIDEPEYCYIPGVGARHFGGLSAGIVFKEISRRSLEYLGVTPDDPYGYPVGDPRYNAEKADWAPEVRKLKEMYEKWNHGKPPHKPAL